MDELIFFMADSGRIGRKRWLMKQWLYYRLSEVCYNYTIRAWQDMADLTVGSTAALMSYLGAGKNSMRRLKQLWPSTMYAFSRLSGTRPIALLTELIRLLAVVAIMSIPRFSHAATVQLISVKETSPGIVFATVGLFTAEPLNPSDFWLRFDGKSAIRAKEVKLAQSVVPETSVIFCVEQSTSMGQPAIQQIRKVLKSVVSEPGPAANAALWVFGTEVRKLHGFSRDASELAASIDEIGAETGRDGKTKLYEAIELALSELRNYQAKGPKRLILITAAEDNGSSITEQVVINEANAQSIAIDTIAFGDVSNADSELLARLAKDTNGHFIFAANALQLARELRKLLDLTPSRVVDVLFQYETAEESHRVDSAQLEFARDGQTPVLLRIKRGLPPPRLGSFGTGFPDHPAIGKQDVDRLIFLWITIGVIGFSAAYIMSRKRAKRAVKDSSASGNTTDWEEP